MSNTGRASTATIRCPRNLGYRRSSASSPSIRKSRSSGICGTLVQTKSSELKQCCSGNGKEVSRKKSKSCSSKSSVSVKLPEPQAMVITKEEYEKYQKCGCEVPSVDEIISVEKEEERLMKESIARKEEFRKMDKMRLREKNTRLDEIEEEARKRTMHILERARNMRMEQEEEIRKCNKIILETKCRAIRDAQIAEKKLIERELADEEKRLNDMMENERRWAIKEELKKDQEEVAKKQKFVNMLKDQILENEVQRIQEFEKKQEESHLINLSNIAWQEEEIAKLKNKAEENARVRNELAEGNAQLTHFKEMIEEENKIIDLRIKEYQKAKEEREAKLAEERRAERLRKEKGTAQVTTQVAQAHDIQAHIDEINAARVQEEVEREWRQKEKEEALKRMENQRMLAKERDQQKNYKKLMQDLEAEREKREFEKIMRLQQEAFLREKEEIEKKQRAAMKHRTEILKQVNQKEKEKIESRQKMFEEGLAIRTEAEMRKKKLQEAMERKCQEMKSNKVPEMYINEVKRMIENVQ